MTRLYFYLCNLKIGKIVLWCYLIWYLVMLFFHFDAKPSLWINSVGISIVIGTGLILSVLPPGGIAAMEKWVLGRLFLMPFCVSSFAALIKDQGFIVVLSPYLTENLIAIGACAAFVATVACLKVTRRTG